jgi:hypothetical protein
MRRFLICCAFLGVTSCAGRRTGPSISDPAGLISRADVAWNDRTEGFDTTGGILAEAYSLQPRNPDVLWRLVRMHVAEGISDSNRRRRIYAFAEARSLGLECLDADPVFAQRRMELGWANALEGVHADRSQCLTWTVLAWARWMSEMGPSATALDLEVVDLMVQSANLVVQDDRDVLAWAQGVLTAIRTDDQVSLETAGSLLRLSIQAQPASLQRRADLVRLVAVPQSQTDVVRAQVEAARKLSPAYPDDVAAWARLVAAEEELP